MIKRIIPEIELFSTPDGRPHASWKSESGLQTLPIRSRRFEHLIQKVYFEIYKDPIRRDELKSTIQIAEGEASFGGLVFDVFNRVRIPADWLF